MAPRVQTANGTLEGTQEGDLAVFRGIPYARPPVGELRFAAPQPAEPWPGVRQATRFGAAAPQPDTGLGALMAIDTAGAGEDCLTLNVWTPGPDEGRRPVMVWIHGGAFVYGSSAQAIYDGGSLARRGDVVVVSLNYRLGALGFLHLAELLEDAGGTGELDTTANAGLLDQVAALAWVRDNIEAFGGDPGNVTIFGESAGSISVTSLLGLPAARGLFRRAVGQSGGPNILSAERATEVARELLTRLDLEPSGARKLLEVPTDALIDAQQQCWRLSTELHRGLPFQPVVDGTVFPRHPLDAVADGAAADVALLLGTNVDEWSFFGFTDPESFTLDDAHLRARLDKVVGPPGTARLLDVYGGGRPGASPADLWFAIVSDWVFRIPSLRLAEAQSRHQPDTFDYLFTWQSPIGGLGACHALEIPFVLGTLDRPGMAVFAGDTPAAHELSAAMQDAWLAFVRTGDPGHPGLPAWPRYDGGRRATMLFGETCRVEDAPFEAERGAWDGLL